MFINCISLTSAGAVAGMNKVVTTTSMYGGCQSLLTFPAYDLTACTSAGSMYSGCWVMQSAPANTNTSAITVATSMFASCTSLENIPAYNFTGLSNATNANYVASTGNLARSQVSNIRFSHSYANSKLAGAQLDEIYTNLPTISAQTITVTGNWGTATDTPTIATAKGWTVTGT
jgi:hypothetical protein